MHSPAPAATLSYKGESWYLWQGTCFLVSISSRPNKKGTTTACTQVYAEIIWVFLPTCFSPEKNAFLRSQLAISASLWSFPGTASADWWPWKCSIFHFLFLDVKPAANSFHRVKLAAAGSGLKALKYTSTGEPPGLLAVSLLVITVHKNWSKQNGCWAWL